MKEYNNYLSQFYEEGSELLLASEKETQLGKRTINEGVSIMRTAAEIKKEVLEAASGDIKAAIAALEDGQYLAGAGYTDGDQETIEVAHAELKEMLN